jgi:hypothetical protein
MVGYVEDYSVNKNTKGNLNEITISLASYTSSPLFNWQTSSIINANILKWSSSIANPTTFKKFDIVYVASTAVNTASISYTAAYNFNTNATNKAELDTEIYYVDDSSIDIGGFKYFFPFKISTKRFSIELLLLCILLVFEFKLFGSF